MRDTGDPGARRAAVRRICAAIPPGCWTTYGDVAEGAGIPGAARMAARIVARDDGVTNAHRVLRAGGRVSEGFATAAGGGPDVARRMLEDEGVAFERSGAADSGRRWVPPCPWPRPDAGTDMRDGPNPPL